ncbi:phenylpyruvate tautomerase MIF-related protein [Pseudomonas fluorescens]
MEDRLHDECARALTRVRAVINCRIKADICMTGGRRIWPCAQIALSSMG